MTDVPQHELDFRVSHRGQGFEFARHGLPLAQLAPLIVRLGSEPRLTELEDWDHDCPHLDRLVLVHVLEEPECFRAAYGIGGNPTAHALLLTPRDAAAFTRSVASGMTCTLSDGSGPDGWEIRTHDNHFTLVSGPDRKVLRDLVAQALQSFVGQLVHEPAGWCP